MPVKIPYGLRDGKLVHISEVESGKACKCIHPILDIPLVAKKGGIKRHHFAANVSSHSASFESFVHLLAKQLLNERGVLTVPAATIPIYTDTSDWFRDFVVGESKVVEVESVQSEKKIRGSRFICDNVCHAKWGELIIEWKNTHETEAEKRDYLIANKIRSIEVDISGWENCDSKDELEKWILHDAPRIWIYDSRLDGAKLANWGLRVERKPCYQWSRLRELSRLNS